MTKKQIKVFVRIVISFFFLLGIKIALSLTGCEDTLWELLYLIPYVVIGYDILRKAFLGMIHGKVFDENFLMSVATVGAVFSKEFTEASAVMLFYQIGELFQSCAVGKSRKNISALMDIRPDYANIEVEGELEQIDPDEVEVSSVIVVMPGEKIPIDGVVIDGNSTLNTSALTGESAPREVTVGDEIISGCVNISGVLKIRTTKEFGESTVSKILDLVENSSMKKAKTENFISRFARYYTPAVCIAAVILAVLPPIVQIVNGNTPMWNDWIMRALNFLVISCPCALVISIPLSFFGGIGGASAQGILVKGSNYLENLAKTKYVVFDKTGTLTKGVFEVTKIIPVKNVSKETLLEMAAHAESYSNHPISKSLKQAYGKEIDRTKISDIQEIAGHGIKAMVAGRTVLAGNEKLMEQEKISYIKTEEAGTVVYVAIDGDYAGCLIIADVIKDTAKEAIAGLKKSGIRKNVMLTGDNRRVAEAIASELGLDEVKSELLPADKVTEVEKLLKEKGEREFLAFVGDGVNDAPVLTRADIGIAMGALGSDAAIEAADIVLMDDDPAKIALAMQISRKTLRIVYENIVFALLIKALCLILSAFGLIGMWWAIFSDVGVMIVAVLNATRTLWHKR